MAIGPQPPRYQAPGWVSQPEQPWFRILNEAGFYADDNTLYPAGTEMIYLGTPNEYMEPLTPAAKEAFDKFQDELDAGARAKAAKVGREYTNRPLDPVEALMLVKQDTEQLARRERVYPGSNGPAPAMETMLPKAEQEKRRRGRPKKVVAVNAPGEVAARPEPKVIGGYTPENVS